MCSADAYGLHKNTQQLMGAFAQFEREIILERQKEGIKIAAAQGKYKGRVHKLNQEQAEALRHAWKEGKYPSKVDLAKAFGISRQAVYRYLKNENVIDRLYI